MTGVVTVSLVHLAGKRAGLDFLKMPQKTFEFQNQLNRLPIPPLEVTAQSYLESCRPFYQSREEQEDYSRIVKDFIRPGGLGEILQNRLIQYEKTQENSWLEKWWLRYAYLSWRNSVLVHSNWYLKWFTFRFCTNLIV
jgi:carnitine O-acetyltransferase